MRDPLVDPVKGDFIKLQSRTAWDTVLVTARRPRVEITLERKAPHHIIYGGVQTSRVRGFTLWQWRVLVAGGEVIKRGAEK